MMPIIWLGIIILAIIVEAVTVSLVSIWFVPPAAVAALLALLSVKPWIQILVFVVGSILSIPLFIRFSKKLLRVKPEATNADAVIGTQAVVTEAIDNLEGRGQVKVKGQIWTARAADPAEHYAVGDIVSVLAIEGVKLICRK